MGPPDGMGALQGRKRSQHSLPLPCEDPARSQEEGSCQEQNPGPPAPELWELQVRCLNPRAVVFAAAVRVDGDRTRWSLPSPPQVLPAPPAALHRFRTPAERGGT